MNGVGVAFLLFFHLNTDFSPSPSGGAAAARALLRGEAHGDRRRAAVGGGGAGRELPHGQTEVI